jgi:4-alpha-glucanotransferase
MPAFPDDPQNFSPYAPSSRRHLNVNHIAVEGEDAGAGGELIDYPEALSARRRALEAAWQHFLAAGGDPAFEAWRMDRGEGLARFAIHQALSEVHGAYWTELAGAVPRSERRGGARIRCRARGPHRVSCLAAMARRV